MKKIRIACITGLFLFSFYILTLAADSAGNRADSTILVAFQTGGHLASVIAPPARIGTFIGSDIEVALDIGSSTYSSSSGNSESTATYSNQGINSRYFLGNSFNILGAIHNRTYSGTATVTSGGSTASGTLEAKATVLTLGIGNHWLMDWGLYIGADWFMLGTALSSSSTATGDYTDSDKKDVEEIGKLINAISTLGGFVAFSIGFAF